MNSLQECDPTIAFQLWLEQARQDNCLHLTIALNYLSQAAFDARFTAAAGSLRWRATPVDSHKSSDPRSVVDTVRHVASQRACRLFNAEYACVTPVSGLEARAIVQHAALRYGDAIFDLSASRGRSTLRVMQVNAIGQLDCVAGCWIDDGCGQIDRDALACRARTHAPAMLRVTATPDWTPIEWEGLAAVANNVGAYFAVDLTHFAGPVAAGLRASPVSSAHFVSLATNGTLRGPHGGIVLARAGFASVIDRAAGGANRDLVGLATKAVVLNEALADSFRAYQWLMLDNAGAMADVLHERGLAAVSGDSGQLVVSDGLSGHMPRALEQLASAHMFADLCRAYCPDGGRSIPAGIGIAAAALTARGLTTEESAYVAHLIADVLHAPLRNDIVKRVRDEVQELCRQFPVAR